MQRVNTYTTDVDQLQPGENVTIAVGFQPDTFADYEMSLFEKLLNVWLIVQGALLAVGIGLVIWLTARYYRWSNRKNEHDPIAPEYLPPKDASVEESARLLGTSKSFNALLIDLAVRHYLKLYQTSNGKGLFSSAEYEIEIIRSIDDLRPEEQEVLRDIFNGKTEVGSLLEMKKLKNDTKLCKRMQDNTKKLKTLVRGDYDLRHKVPEQSDRYSRLGKWALLATVLLLSPAVLVVTIVAFVMS